MNKFLIFMGIFSFFSSCNQEKNKYIVGQEWNYKTRKGEENSTLKILKIENYKEDGKIIHISISGLKIKNNQSPNGLSEEIGHIPITEDALIKSTTEIKNQKTQLPYFNDGYSEWKRAFDNKQAGMFSIPVSEIIDSMEETFKKGQIVNE